MSTTNPHRQPPSSRPSTTPSYRPPLTIHPAATVPDSTSFQGTYPITIGAGTVIHPRTKFLSFDGPIRVGDGCIIGEKSVIGGPQTSPSPSPSPDAPTTMLENSILIGPLTTISAGTTISDAATVDTSAILGRRVRVGKHAKVCPSCCIPDDGVVDDWTVIWGGTAGGLGEGGGAGGNTGSRLQRRRRANGGQQQGDEDSGGGFGGAAVEKGRLGVLEREREGLTKLIGAGGGARRK
ncbi:hypothetical protein AJ79_08705 [Helicocarpus griseus UAMH5409]|uniref:Dynactin subunit 6 n=1 Tax=Helicocarpus griseus UAMH5409 TaxID=1447875 RepID=A0A2B7WRG3_9EURO|nr:hypothetical protein AJ79_08705 [Helicocarpus griseus UAMH5409]